MFDSCHVISFFITSLDVFVLCHQGLQQLLAKQVIVLLCKHDLTKKHWYRLWNWFMFAVKHASELRGNNLNKFYLQSKFTHFWSFSSAHFPHFFCVHCNQFVRLPAHQIWLLLLHSFRHLWKVETKQHNTKLFEYKWLLTTDEHVSWGFLADFHSISISIQK